MHAGRDIWFPVLKFALHNLTLFEVFFSDNGIVNKVYEGHICGRVTL